VESNAFGAYRFAEILKFLPFFLFFYVVNSVAMNVFNFIRLGKKEWINTLVMAFFNILGAAILLVIAYVYFFSTGNTPTDYAGWGLTSMIFWLISMLVILPIATVLSRVIYKATANPYLPAITLAVIITMLCAKTLTTL
jgi:hypothetical protein